MKRLLVLIPIALLLSGCFSQTRSETTKTDRITFQAQVPVPTAEGVKVVPVTGTIRRVGTGDIRWFLAIIRVTETGKDRNCIRFPGLTLDIPNSRGR